MRYSWCLLLTVFAGFGHAQSTFTASDEIAPAGSTAEVSITLSTTSAIRGFSFGLTHPSPSLAVAAIEPGSVLQALHGGAGADFFQVETTPSGGPGAVVGAVFSIGPPIEEIGPGDDFEVVTLEYELSGLVPPGATFDLSFTPDLGDPPVIVMVSVAGVTEIPAVEAGSITVAFEPVESVACAVIDGCSCLMDVSWVAGSTNYDSFEILVDDVVVATVAGDQSSVQLTVDPGPGVLCVRGTVGPTVSAPVCCSFDCAAPPTGGDLTGLDCSVDLVTCEVALTWTNAGPYDSIEVQVAGTMVAMLPGDTESTTVTVAPAVDPVAICLVPVTLCGDPLMATCCDVTCTVPLIRGDCNDDGQVDISDPVAALGALFQSMPIGCSDACDGNDDGGFDIADAVSLLEGLFSGGPPPAVPFPQCGGDPTPDTLTCELYQSCP